jgi:hypothetical protein
MDLRAVIFVPALVGSLVCGFVFLIYAAHYYLTVLESTAAGAKEVTWLSEPITDSFWKPFYLAWLLCLWLGPAYILGRGLARGANEPWLALAVPVFVAWALYPVSQLSSLCSTSVWIPLHPQVFARLAQKPAVTLGFFVFTLPVFALGGLAFKWAFLTSGEWMLLFGGAPLLALAGLLYARFLGRLAFALMFTRDLLKRKKKKKPAASADQRADERADEPTEEPDAEQEPAPVQPGDLPPISTPEGELAGYNILIADDPPPPKKRVRAELAEDEPPEPAPPPPPAPKPPRKSVASDHPLDRARVWTEEDDEEPTPYGVHAAEGKVTKEAVPEEVLKPTATEMALLDRSDVPKAPKLVWSLELFAFLLQPGTVAALFVLSGLGAFAGVMIRVARAFNPVAGSG